MAGIVPIGRKSHRTQSQLRGAARQGSGAATVGEGLRTLKDMEEHRRGGWGGGILFLPLTCGVASGGSLVSLAV